jgi:hypothetical protein
MQFALSPASYIRTLPGNLQQKARILRILSDPLLSSGLRRTLLHRAHDDILSALVPAPGFIEHAIGFAYAGGVAQKNLEFCAPALALLSLDLLEESFGTRPGKFGYAHGVSVNRKQCRNVRAQTWD